jgi:hypothetical protein
MTILRGALLLILPAALAQQPSSPFVSVPVRPSDTLQFGAPLPDFEAADIHGHTWRTRDLHGKFTLICIWGTFFARAADRLDPHARANLRFLLDPDLPGLQRFYDRVKDAPNLQVLTFCKDYDYTHAPEYMQERQYTFPVIADWVLLKKLFPEGGNYRVIDPQGRVSYPFRSWTFGRILMEIESRSR